MYTLSLVSPCSGSLESLVLRFSLGAVVPMMPAHGCPGRRVARWGVAGLRSCALRTDCMRGPGFPTSCCCGVRFTYIRGRGTSMRLSCSQILRKGRKMFRYRVPSLNATDVVECEALRLDPIKSTRQMDNLAPELHTGEGTHSWTKTRVVGVCPRCVRRDPRSKTGLDSSLSVGKKNRRRRLLQHEVRLNTPP